MNSARPAAARSIRLRLALGAALQTAVALLVVSAVQFVALDSFLDLSEHERLETLLPGLAVEVSRQLATAHLTTAQPATAQPAAAAPGRPLDVDPLAGGVDVRVLQGGRVLARSDNFPAVPLNTPDGYQPLAGHSVLTAPVTIRGRPATAQLASDVLGIVHPLRAYLRVLSLTVPLAAALVALLSFLLAGRMLRPLTLLQQAAARLGRERDLRATLPGAERQDEVGLLAGALQSSFRQLAEVQEREVAFTRAAAHDLRSPLTALKIRLQGALARPRTAAELHAEVGEALADVDRMTRLTEHLLLLASGQSQVQREALELARTVGEVVDRVRERSPEVLLEFWTHGDTQMVGDRALIVTLSENLLGNALRHAAGSDIQVRVEPQGDRLALSVSDRGPGVPEEALPHLSEAFYRVDAARAGMGNGLGLAIVRRAAEAHAGAVMFRNLRPVGFQVEVTFPRAPMLDDLPRSSGKPSPPL